MLLAFSFLVLTSIYFLHLYQSSVTFSIGGGVGSRVSYGCNAGNIYWQQTRICSSKEGFAFVKDLLWICLAC